MLSTIHCPLFTVPYLSMTTRTKELYEYIIELLGDDKIDELYYLLGSERISFATLKRIQYQKKIKKLLEDREPVSEVAKKALIHKRAVYRLIKKSDKPRKK